MVFDKTGTLTEDSCGKSLFLDPIEMYGFRTVEYYENQEEPVQNEDDAPLTFAAFDNFENN